MSNYRFNKLKQRQNIVITIDGAAATGKTTLGQQLAQHFQLEFLDSGVLYRALVWFYQQKQINLNNIRITALKQHFSEFEKNVRFQDNYIYFQNAKLIKSAIYNLEIDQLIPFFVNWKWIRKKITLMCRNIIANKNIIVVGRDSGTVIAPHAQLKFFLESDLETRVKRKITFLQTNKSVESKLINKQEYAKWKQKIQKRDQNDQTRTHGPLQKAHDAVTINNTKLNLQDNVTLMIKIIDDFLTQPQLPQITIIGQTNVGKSTIFNILCQQNAALISNINQTTRDLNTKIIQQDSCAFFLTDTGGFSKFKHATDDKTLHQNILIRTQSAIDKSDWLLWVVDYNQGLTAFDFELAKKLKKQKSKILLIINKTEKMHNPVQLEPFQKLGIKNYLAVVAKKKTNMNLVWKWIKNKTVCDHNFDKSQQIINIMLMGKTNVGKSTLFNQIFQQDINITSSAEHTTTNIVEKQLHYQNYTINFIDSAGIRKKRQKSDFVERAAVYQIEKTLQKINLVWFILDITTPLTVQDKKIMRLIVDANKPFVIIGNKMDKTKNNDQQIIQEIKHFFPFVRKKDTTIFLCSAIKFLICLNRLIPTSINLYKPKITEQQKIKR